MSETAVIPDGSQVFDGTLLTAVDPAGEDDDEEVPRLEDGAHGCSRGCLAKAGEHRGGGHVSQLGTVEFQQVKCSSGDTVLFRCVSGESVEAGTISQYAQNWVVQVIQRLDILIKEDIINS